MKYKLIIFDLDGTILNTIDDLADSLNYILDKFGYPTHSIEKITSFVGCGIKNLITKALPQNISKDDLNTIVDSFNAHYKLNCNNKTAPYPGIIELIKKLKIAGYKIAVVSNKADYGVQALCKLHFNNLFDYVVGEREGIAKKPSPDAVFEVQRLLNGNKDNTLYIGDSEVDIQTANNAEIDCICVTWGFRTKDMLIKNGGKTFVNTTDELYKLIKHNA